MDNETEKLSILKFTKPGSSIEDMVAKESPLTIILNNRELVTLLCDRGGLRQGQPEERLYACPEDNH